MIPNDNLIEVVICNAKPVTQAVYGSWSIKCMIDNQDSPDSSDVSWSQKLWTAFENRQMCDHDFMARY